jgi:hypothetical protein
MSMPFERRHPRIPMRGRMQGHVTSLGVAVTIREISLGGLSMETRFSLPIGVIHDFSLTLGDASSVQLRGRVVYSREAASPEGAPLYVTGIQFLDDEPAAVPVGDLIDKLK